MSSEVGPARPSFLVVAVALALGGWALTACDIPPERATGSDAARALASFPEPGAENVDRLAAMWVAYDRPLAPVSVTTGTVRVVSGPRVMPIAVRADPTLPGLRVELLASMDPEARWELRVQGVRDLDDVVAGPYVVELRTGSVRTPRADVTPRWAEVAPIFERACASCHDATTRTAGLDLSSAEGVRATALGAASIQTGPRPSPGAIGAGVLGALAGMRRIEVIGTVGQPEHSYLVYKLLGDAHIIGEQMPPPRDGGAGPLSREEIERVAEWIRGGAPTE